MNKLALHVVEDTDVLAWPEDYKELTLLSPALDFFTDFNLTKPLIIDSNTTAIDAEKLMMKAHVRLKLVLDQHERFLGLVSHDNLSEEEFVKRLAKGDERKNLLVSDFMIPKSKLKVIDFTDLKFAKIGDVISTLKSAGQQHCLVVERRLHKIRGVFSANDIAKRLKLSIDVTTPTSFSSVFEVISKVNDTIVA